MKRLPQQNYSVTAATFDRRIRNAFTLIEVTLAVALTTLLMAALYSAMSVYWTTATESYDEVERAQIARAILREMARDIRSCTFVQKDTMDSEEEEDSGSMDAMSTEDALGVYTDGLFGTDRDLVLYINPSV